MRSLSFDGPWEMSVVDRPDPAAREGEVVIAIIATGICGSDVHGYSGETNRRVGGQVMGHETVGRVLGDHPGLADGELVTVNPMIGCGHCAACLEGDTQVCPDITIIGVEPTLDGSFAERLVMPRANVVPLGDHVPPLHGALVEPLAVGYHAVLRGDAVPSDRLLILGGGPIGQASAIAARRLGIESVLVSEPSPARRDLLVRLGFAVTTPGELTADRDRVLGGPATLVVDAVGISATMADAIAHSAPRARIVLVGLGTPEMRLEPYGISTAERVVYGSYCYSDARFRDTAAWVAEGHAELDLLIDSTVGLDGAGDAFRALAENPEAHNKILVLSGSGSDAAFAAGRATESVR